MTHSSEKDDNLEFTPDCEYTERNKKKVPSAPPRDLADYFSFLEDIAPASSLKIKRRMPIDKVFEL